MSLEPSPPRRLAKTGRKPGGSPPGISLKLRFEGAKALGPGKVRLLELIDELGSIYAAGKAMRMSYGRAWKLASEVNGIFNEPLILAQHGGSQRGGASLTALGVDIVTHYRAIEADILARSAGRLSAIEKAVRKHEPVEESPAGAGEHAPS